MKPEIIKILKKDNNFQHLEVLSRNRYKRFRHKEIFVEGVKPINTAIENKWDILYFVHSDYKELSHWAKKILVNSSAKKHFQLPNEYMGEISDKEDPSEIIAILSMPEDDLSKIKLSEHPLVAIFDRPSDPGNLGTIIRSCDALQVDGLVITGHCVDLYDPKVIRSSIGTIFTLPVIKMESYKKLLPWFSEIKELYPDFQIVGTSVHTDNLVYEGDFNKPTALIIGNETSGMSASYRELSDYIFKIPIFGSASSLNVACASSMVLYEIARQRQTS